MKKVIRLNEHELKNIITNSVKTILNESFPNGSNRSGFDKWTTVNSPSSGNTLYSVELGSGLTSHMFYAFGFDEQDALDAVVDYLEKKGNTSFFYDDEEIAQEYPDDYITAGNHCHLLAAHEIVIHELREA